MSNKQPSPGDRIIIVSGDLELINEKGIIAKVYKNGHVLGMFSSEKMRKNFISNPRGFVPLRLRPDEFEIYDNKIISIPSFGGKKRES